MNKKQKSIAAIAAVGIIGLAAVPAGAAVDNLIGSGKIRDNSIRSIDLKDGKAVGTKDLRPGLLAAISREDDDRPDAYTVSDTATVANIGGEFGKFTDTVRATEVEVLHLTPGKWLVQSDGFFKSNQATSGLTRMQLALRVNDGSDEGLDYGTCFTGAMSPLADREGTCSTSRVVEVDPITQGEGIKVQIFAFGYADDEGAADSGKIDVTAHVNAIQVD